jgi:hypothetical protein
MVGAGDIDTAAGTHGVGEDETVGDIGEVFFARGGVGVEHVLPGADLSDDDVLGGEGVANGTDAIGVGGPGGGTVSGTVAETAVLASEEGGVVGLEEDGATETDGAGGGSDGGGGEEGEEGTAGEGHDRDSIELERRR